MLCENCLNEIVMPPIERSGFKLDPPSGELWIQGRGESILLTPIETAMLYYLMLNAGNICPMARIAAYVWGGDDCEPDNFKAHLKLLRRKIGDTGGYRYGTFIRTRPSFGYVFVGLNGGEFVLDERD